MDSNNQNHIILRQLLATWDEISKRLLQHPEQLWQNQFSYWQDFTSLCQDMTQGTTTANPFTDNRFKHSEWQQNLVFNFIQRTYLLLTQHVDNLVTDLAKGDVKTAQKLRFFTRQFLDAMAPTNFANMNPEVLEKIAATNGANLVTGLKQFLQDLSDGNGFINIKMTDTESFKLGENIAITPGKVIYQNDVMQLIQYTATTDQAYERPLLIIPPWINKFYILDLQPENSLVKWLRDQGFTVFMLSWVNATAEHSKIRFTDYMKQGVVTAIKKIRQMTHVPQINVLGYCVGGTLLGCTLAYLAKKNLAWIHSATFLTTLFDFSEPGEIGAFIDKKQISLLEKDMQKKGYMDGKAMAAVFNALRANDLIWFSFVNNYLKGQQPKPFDLLFWNADVTNIPAKVHSFYLRNMYLHNQLREPDKIKLANVTIDLNQITTPSYFLAAQDDHIIPWKSSYESKQILNGPVKFVLTTSGHVAGVINPPQKNKYGYWTNSLKTSNPEKYLETASFHPGSWWEDWREWLVKYSGELRNVDELHLTAENTIEDAPGSYVKTLVS